MRPEGEPRAGVRPGRADADPGVHRGAHDLDRARVGVDRDVGADLRRVIADEHRDEDREQHAETRDAAECDLPAGRVQQGCQGSESQELTRLTDEAGELTHQRPALRGEPCGDEAEDAREDRGVTCTEQHAREDRDPDAGGEGESQLPGRHQQHADGHDRPGAVAVEQQPDRNLHSAIDRELHHGEHRQRRGIRTEPLSRVDTDRRQRAAVDHRKHVRRDPDAPDEPAAPPRSRCGGAHTVESHPSTLLLPGGAVVGAGAR